MHGDFSRWFPQPLTNQSGILHQQGRVLLDADVNAATLINTRRDDLAARAAFGPGVAAIPADQPDAFRVSGATLAGGQITLTIKTGVVWADGILAELESDPGPGGAARRHPLLLGPPLQPILGTAGTRDAVVLEVWRQSLSAFQRPDELIERALGGPDTAERMETAFAFRLARMQDGETCEGLGARLRDDLGAHGGLRATLEPPTVVKGDCPVAEGGGYSGFEHNLYRIEIANVPGAPRFKWSQFGGGLVGRGTFNAGSRRLTITANQQAILRSNLSSFYLEALDYDLMLGGWKVSYGANVMLLNNGDIDLGVNPTVGTVPLSTNTHFFRLWNGLRLLSDFPAASSKPSPLSDGIHLAFATASAGTYLPGDYWTFAVRANDVNNPATLVDGPPQGVHRHRAPLAELLWGPTPGTPQIQDCRRLIQPLTPREIVSDGDSSREGCCTFSVGDGTTSHGDFATIQQAIDHLPPEGGRVCVLPGNYAENVSIAGKTGVTIAGCGGRSRVLGQATAGGATPSAVFTITDARDIRIESLAILGAPRGSGILVDGGPASGGVRGRSVALVELAVMADGAAAIDVRDAIDVTIARNRIEQTGSSSEWPAVVLRVTNGIVERNLISVKPTVVDGDLPSSDALGGIWLRGGCQNVKIADNELSGGSGIGVMLGDARPAGKVTATSGDNLTHGYHYFAGGRTIDRPGRMWLGPSVRDGSSAKPAFVAASPLVSIAIERNRIVGLGLSGIGVIGFWPEAAREVISVRDLRIVENFIEGCLRRPLERIAAEAIGWMGYGAIGLADVEVLIVRDNVISDNQPPDGSPVCGIFVLSGEYVEIDRNIVGNRTPTAGGSEDMTLSGPCGGIWLQMVMARSAKAGDGSTTQSAFDYPAGRLHDNTVDVAVGRALTAWALGPLWVADNLFTTHGLTNDSMKNGGVVLIENFGVAAEWRGGFVGAQALRWGAMAGGPQSNYAMSVKNNVDPDGQQTGTSLEYRPRSSAAASAAGAPTAGGAVHFAGNRCNLAVAVSGGKRMFASVIVIAFDDVGFHDNLCVLALGLGRQSTVNAYILGLTVRTTGNRFQEGIADAWLSAITLAALNVTALNQSTHCILARGTVQQVPPASSLFSLNNELPAIDGCKWMARLLTNFGGAPAAGDNP